MVIVAVRLRTLKKKIIFFTFFVSVWSGLLLPRAMAATQPEVFINPYKFAGSCSTQGEWTAQALYNSTQIRSYVQQLQNDPNCTAMTKELIGNLDESIKELAKVQNEKQASQNSSLLQLPHELGAFRSALQSMSSTAPASLKSAGLLSLIKGTKNLLTSEGLNPAQIKLMESLRTRINQTADSAFSNFSVLTQKLPEVQKCLTDSNTMSSLLSMSVRTVSAFLQSGASLNSEKVAQAIAQISESARQMKFNEITNELNKAEFIQSMSCIIEITSEAYCSARDTQFLQSSYIKDFFIQHEVKSFTNTESKQNSENKMEDFFKKVNNTEKTKVTQAQSASEADVISFRAKLKNFDEKLLDSKYKNNPELLNDPSYGLFILSHHVANINQWIQEIQLGVDPKLDTDAVFKNRVLETANGFLQKVNTLKGAVSQQVTTILNEPKLQTKKSMTLRLIETIVDNLTIQKSGDQNFFVAQVPAMQIPFVLTGIPMPPQVSGNTGGVYVQRMSYEEYFQVNMNNIEQFNDPAAMLNTIQTNLNLIVLAANSSMIEYYNKWFIVDKTLIIQKSLTGVNYSIYDSFVALRAYVQHLVTRIQKYGNGDLAELQLKTPGMRQLIAHLDKVIEAYEPVKNLAYLMDKKYIEISNCKNQILEDAKADKNNIENGQANSISQTVNKNQATCLPDKDLLQLIVLDLSKLNKSENLGGKKQISTQSVADVYSKIVETVFQEFNVLLSRSSFLNNRMSEYIETDYILSKRLVPDFAKYENEILSTTGRILIERIANMTSGNITSSSLDLAEAMKIHKETNLYATEKTFKGYLFPFLRRLKVATEHSEYNNFTLFMQTNSDIMKDFTLKPEEKILNHKKIINSTESTFMQRLMSLLGLPGELQSKYSRKILSTFWIPYAYLVHSDRYEFKNPIDWKVLDSNKRNGDTEFSSLKTILAKYCTQVLAFNGWYEFKSICADQNLYSPFYKNFAYSLDQNDPKRNELLSKFNSYYSVLFNEKAYESLSGPLPRDFTQFRSHQQSELQFRSALNQSQRICALRDYVRRNQALILTSQTE